MEEKKLEFNKTYLEAYQIGLDDLELFRKELSEKHQEIEDKFNKDNAEMIERINKLSEECGLEKIQFKWDTYRCVWGWHNWSEWRWMPPIPTNTQISSMGWRDRGERRWCYRCGASKVRYNNIVYNRGK